MRSARWKKGANIERKKPVRFKALEDKCMVMPMQKGLKIDCSPLSGVVSSSDLQRRTCSGCWGCWGRNLVFLHHQLPRRFGWITEWSKASPPSFRSRNYTGAPGWWGRHAERKTGKDLQLNRIFFFSFGKDLQLKPVKIFSLNWLFFFRSLQIHISTANESRRCAQLLGIFLHVINS